MMTGVFTNDMCIYFGEKVSVISVIKRHFFLEDSQMQLHLNNEQEKIYFFLFQIFLLLESYLKVYKSAFSMVHSIGNSSKICRLKT